MTLRGVQRTSNTPYQNVFLFDLKKITKTDLYWQEKINIYNFNRHYYNNYNNLSSKVSNLSQNKYLKFVQ
jgi:hypothetical protein